MVSFTPDCVCGTLRNPSRTPNKNYTSKPISDEAAENSKDYIQERHGWGGNQARAKTDHDNTR
jgi:hypothetical protein